MYSLLDTGQQIFHPSSDSLTSLCEVSSEDIVKPFFLRENSVRKMEACSRSTGLCTGRAGARAQPLMFQWSMQLFLRLVESFKGSSRAHIKRQKASAKRHQRHLNPGSRSSCSLIMLVLSFFSPLTFLALQSDCPSHPVQLRLD